MLNVQCFESIFTEFEFIEKTYKILELWLNGATLKFYRKLTSIIISTTTLS